MKKTKLLSLVLTVAMVTALGQGANALDARAENVFDIASSEFTMDKAPQLSYVVYGFTSLDSNAPEEFNKSSQYIENYSIEFLYQDDVAKQKSNAANVIKSGTIDIMDADTITIPTSKISKLGTEEIELPLINEDMKKEITSLSKEGIKSVLRNISVNVFYSNPDFCELDKLSDNEHSEEHSDTMSVQKSSVAGGVGTMGSEQQNFHRMYASIYAYDEYSGSQKRQSFSAYHSKYSPLNQLVEGMAYVSTYQKDSRPDVIALGWSLGGAIGMYDSSINLQAAYNLQCEICQLNVRTNYAYNTFTQSSSDVSRHNSLFTGQAIGFNIPDIGIGQCNYCWSGIATRPASMNISAKSGWYNKGSYNGANGVVRSEYLHTYTGYTLTLSPSISIPYSISFTPSLVENQDFEKTWVYTTISPN